MRAIAKLKSTIKVNFKHSSPQIVSALFKGWRVRRIMRTKEIQQRVLQLKQFSQELLNTALDRGLAEMLRQSIRNSKIKLATLVQRMQQNGFWLEYEHNNV